MLARGADSQGIIFQFQATGTVYYFSFSYLINTLLAGVVLMSVAATITDLIAFNLLPGGHSDILTATRFEKVSRKRYAHASCPLPPHPCSTTHPTASPAAPGPQPQTTTSARD